MAPSAQLFLICVESEVGLANAVGYAKANGITIVNHSVGWFNTSRGDGTGGAGTPDAIVADISMPKLDGIQACVLIRRTNPDARIVLVTIHAEPVLVESGLAAGALDPAPTTPEQFRKKIAGELERWARVIKDAGIKQE